MSTYVGQQYARAPGDFDNETNYRMFSVGKLLHCVVRATANKTPPDVPAHSALRDYEYKVFQSRWETPYNLAVEAWVLAHFFAGRTRLVQKDFIKKHVQDGESKEKLEELLKERPKSSYDEAKPVHPVALEYGLLHVILGMTETEWRFSFQAIHALDLLGLTESITEAANLLSACGHSDKKPESYRSDWSRGCDYLKENSIDVIREVASQELKDVKTAAYRNGLQSVVALLLTDETDQAVFLQLVSKLLSSQIERSSKDFTLKEVEG